MKPARKTTKKPSATPPTKPADTPEPSDASAARTPSSALKGNAAKWTPEVWGAGWTGLPNALIEGKKRLGLTDAEFVVVVYLIRRWYTRDAPVFPSRETIGSATDKSVRAVQRALDGLVRAGFITKKFRRRADTGNFTSSVYTFEGLVEALRPIADDLRKAAKDRTDRAEASAADARKRKPRSAT